MTWEHYCETNFIPDMDSFGDHVGDFREMGMAVWTATAVLALGRRAFEAGQKSSEDERDRLEELNREANDEIIRRGVRIEELEAKEAKRDTSQGQETQP